MYREELEQWHAQGVLSELHVAFSRQGRDKVYVQHLLKQRGKQVRHRAQHVTDESCVV